MPGTRKDAESHNERTLEKIGENHGASERPIKNPVGQQNQTILVG